MKLRTYVISLLSAAAILPLLAVFVSLTIYSSRQRESLVSLKLNNVYGGVVSYYERTGTSIAHQLENVMKDQAMLRYLIIKDDAGYIDQKGLIDHTVMLKGLLGFDYLTILSADGLVLARGHDPGFFGDNLKNDPVFSEALKGHNAQSLATLKKGDKEQLTILAAAPVWFENRELIGVIAAGKSLDEEFCRNLRDLSGAEILLVQDGKILAKTIPGRSDELILYMKERRIYQTAIQGINYTFATYPLMDLSGKDVADLMMGVSTYDLDLQYKNVRVIYGGFAVAGLFVAIIFGFMLSKKITKPVEQLIAASEQLAQGDFSVRVDYQGQREFSTLTGTFNKMAEDLENNRNRLVESERLQAFTQMARKVAHEIKNPLTPIKVAIEDLRRSKTSSDPNFSDVFDHSTRTALEEVNSITRILDEFSEFARFPSPKLAPEDLNAIALSAISLFSVEKNQGKLKTVLFPGKLVIQADRDQMKRAIFNLVKNGLEAISPIGSVTVTSALSDRKAILSVIDNGTGLSGPARQNIFTPYFTTKPGGTGLGLVIVKKIISEHEGDIIINDNPQGGTIVSIELPLHKMT